MADKGGLPTGPLAKLGYTIAAAGLAGLFPGVREVLTSFLAKRLEVPNPDVPIWMAFAVVIVGVVLVLLDWVSVQGFGRPSKQLLALKHTSLNDVPPSSLDQPDLPSRDGRLSAEQILCDLAPEMSHGHTEIAEAIRKQQRIMQGLAIRLQATPRPKLAYYGIAHIPFQVWAGCQLTHTGAYLYELLRERGTWQELSTARIKKFPVTVQKIQAGQQPHALVIRIAVSFPVGIDDIKDVVAAPFDDVLISVAQPQRDLITHYQQVEAIALVFRQVLDEGMQRLPRDGAVHVFFAGPMSVGFELGRRVSVSNHPAVIVYNHTRQTSPRYAWAICVNRPSNPDVLRFPTSL